MDAPDTSTQCIRGCCCSSSVRLDLSSSEIKIRRPLSSGSEGDVLEAEFRGQPVAIKKPRLTSSEDTNRFHSELRLLCGLHHPSLAQFLGARGHPPDYFLLFKLYEGGNLHEALHLRGWEPTLAEAMGVALDVAQAMEYMHSTATIHRDVKPGNILLDAHANAILSDLGLAASAFFLAEQAAQKWVPRGKPTGGFNKAKVVGTTQYMAPEVLRGQGHTPAADVYSFGITLNEVLTRVVPFADCKTAAQPHTVLEMAYTQQQLMAAITGDGLRPVLYGYEEEQDQLPETARASAEGKGEIHEVTGTEMEEDAVPASSVSVQSSKEAKEKLQHIIQLCWQEDPVLRPSMSSVVADLQAVLAKAQAQALPAAAAAAAAAAGAGAGAAAAVEVPGAAAGAADVEVAGASTWAMTARQVAGAMTARLPLDPHHLRVGPRRLGWVGDGAVGIVAPRDTWSNGLSDLFSEGPPRCTLDAAAPAQGGTVGAPGSTLLAHMRSNGPQDGMGEADTGYRGPVLSGGWVSSQGGRETMEDAHCQAVLTFTGVSSSEPSLEPAPLALGSHSASLPPGWHLQQHLGSSSAGPMSGGDGSIAGTSPFSSVHMFGVFDGHRGAAAASFCAQHLPSIAAKHLLSSSSLSDALKCAFLEADSELESALELRGQGAGAVGSGSGVSGAGAGGKVPDGGGAVAGGAGSGLQGAGGEGGQVPEGAGASLPQLGSNPGGDEKDPGPSVVVRPGAAPLALERRPPRGRSRPGTVTYPGCAAAFAVIVGEEILVANAGDCRTVLCSGGKAMPLSTDHLASSASERQRLVSAGASVSWRVNTWRVGNAGIEVSRSLGDHDLKPAVTAEPHVVHHRLSPKDEFLVMASDGLWSAVGNEEVVATVNETVKEPTMVAKRLGMLAGERGNADNITVLVLFLRPVTTLERIY